MNDNHRNSLASSAQVSTQTGEGIAIVLAMVAGYVDAYGFICYRTYLSFMSGNTTQSGFMIGQMDVPGATPTLLAIVSFVIGVFAGTLLIYPGTRRSRRLTFGLVATLLALDIGATQLAGLGGLPSIAILSIAMGIMNTTFSRVGAEKMNLTFVSGTLNKIGSHLALAVKRVPVDDAQGTWDTHIRRAFLLLGLWAAFFLGAILASVGTPRFGIWVLLVPFLVLLALTIFNPTTRESE